MASNKSTSSQRVRKDGNEPTGSRKEVNASAKERYGDYQSRILVAAAVA